MKKFTFFAAMFVALLTTSAASAQVMQSVLLEYLERVAVVAVAVDRGCCLHFHA